MIIWRGYGFLVAVITFAVSLLTELMIEKINGDPTFYQSHSWPLAVALVISAAIIWTVDNRMSNQPEKVLIDKETGNEVSLKRSHELFFIKMKYWPAILLC